MIADIGREAVYAAEIAAFDATSHETVTPFAELLGLAAMIVEAAWWPHGEIELVPARSDAGSSSTRQRNGSAPVVRLAAPQMTPATVVHEFAHVLAGLAHGHDAVFRRAHLDLVGYVLGDEPAGWLLEAYAAMGLQPGVRAWSAPPRRAGGPLEL